jgi:diguanylate cyclase (GGDEF)-like protein
MHLDVPTLMFAGAFGCALCAGFLSFSWWQSRERAALWWAAAFLTQAAAVGLLALSFVVLPPLFLAGLILLIASPALVWCGFRAFFRVPLRPLPIAAGFLLWPASLGLPEVDAPDWAPIVVHTLLVIAFNGAVVAELLRHRSEHLRARIPLVVLTLVNIAVFALAIPEALQGGLRGAAPPPLASMFGLIHFETLMYAIGATVFLVALIKERGELLTLHEARTDSLTGLANRRAFLEMSERVADRCRRKGEPIAVAVFDLDRFKNVNDTFGHAIGDEVLRVFAGVVRETLRPGDIISRVGGEEFFAVLPGANLEDGCSMANRVRQAFAEASAFVGGCQVRATVSAGVMACRDATTPLATLLEKADAALYRAKLNGRNCVQCGLGELQEKKAYPQLVRVA